jgi:phosphatidate cytidylyltransferase
MAAAVSSTRVGALTRRVASGALAVPLLLGVAFFGDPNGPGWVVYGLLICAACGYAALELRSMLLAAGYAPLDLPLFGVAVLLPLDTWLRSGTDPRSIAPDGMLLIVIAVVVSLTWLLLRRRQPERAMVNWALSLALALYVGGLMQFYFPLRRLPTEVPGFWVLALLGLSWVCDTSAYFVGRAMGRTPLAPAISPKKTVEGAVAGLVASALFGLALSIPTAVPPLLLAGYGAAIGLATILGDLVESLLKRQTGVKDSGVLIPGHGGLLDRMDSLLLCAPIAVTYLHVFGT